MKRSQAVHLSLVASVAALLVTCDQRARRYCVDGNQNVTDDQNCGRMDPRYHWYYARGFGSVQNGTRVSGGSYIPPANGYRSRSGGGEAAGAGTVRGGIGGAGEAAAAHGGFGGHGGGGGE